MSTFWGVLGQKNSDKQPPKNPQNFINRQRSIDADMVVISSLKKIIHAHHSILPSEKWRTLKTLGGVPKYLKGKFLGPKQDQSRFLVMTEWFFSDQKFSEYKIAIVSSFAILVWLHTTTGHDYRGKNQQPFYKFLCWI